VNYLRPVPDDQKAETARQAEVWGYPRDINQMEINSSLFARYGNLAIIWFMDGPEPESFQIHAVTSPLAGSVMGTLENVAKVKAVAEWMGAKRLYSLIPRCEATEHLPVEAMRRYFRIRGWEENQWGSYVDLGGE
jgi:hypothetical protein